MVPPSIVLIIYGLTANVSVGDLFSAAFLPGLMLAGFYAALARAESGHARLFAELAERYDPEGASDRLRQLARHEAEIVAGLPLEPRIH